MFIGTIIKDLRIKSNMTQKELSDILFVTVPYISQIENSKRTIPEDILIKLSNIFGIDLISISNSFRQFFSFSEFEKYYFLREVVELKNINAIENCLNDFSDIFNTNESILLYNYCTALVLAIKYNNYLESIDLCFYALKLDKDIILNNIKNTVYTNSAYSIFVLITYNYTMLGKYEIALKLCNELVLHYKSIISDVKFSYLKQDFFFKKTFIIFLNNYTYILYKTNNFKEALHYCEYAINKSSELNVLNQLYSLLESKIEILYALNNFENAQNTYTQLKTLCEITQNTTFLDNTKKLINDKYPLLNI